ncbi:hypothetical protein Francci3_1017 [Frankia casuarinae]|uniref:Uncharacterized protein n=1 Tax=Frankia casuarinae (strain DSM 45818 / CECT 9043 / HFP020203 / CcI3) TaxID=106370 RepID=Q2JE92_FRACC|nr:hypothetical protein Francci3_1017 [Frankia casuarinae]
MVKCSRHDQRARHPICGPLSRPPAGARSDLRTRPASRGLECSPAGGYRNRACLTAARYVPLGACVRVRRQGLEPRTRGLRDHRWFVRQRPWTSAGAGRGLAVVRQVRDRSPPFAGLAAIQAASLCDLHPGADGADASDP